MCHLRNWKNLQSSSFLTLKAYTCYWVTVWKGQWERGRETDYQCLLLWGLSKKTKCLKCSPCSKCVDGVARVGESEWVGEGWGCRGSFFRRRCFSSHLHSSTGCEVGPLLVSLWTYTCLLAGWIKWLTHSSLFNIDLVCSWGTFGRLLLQIAFLVTGSSQVKSLISCLKTVKWNWKREKFLAKVPMFNSICHMNVIFHWKQNICSNGLMMPTLGNILSFFMPTSIDKIALDMPKRINLTCPLAPLFSSYFFESLFCFFPLPQEELGEGIMLYFKLLCFTLWLRFYASDDEIISLEGNLKWAVHFENQRKILRLHSRHEFHIWTCMCRSMCMRWEGERKCTARTVEASQDVPLAMQ